MAKCRRRKSRKSRKSRKPRSCAKSALSRALKRAGSARRRGKILASWNKFCR